MITPLVFTYIGIIVKRDAPHLKIKFAIDTVFNVYRLYINGNRTEITIPYNYEKELPENITDEQFVIFFMDQLSRELSNE